MSRCNWTLPVVALIVAMSALLSVLPAAAAAGDFAQWAAQASGTKSDLYGVWGSSSTDIFAAGSAGTVLHYDGKAWSTMAGGTKSDFHGLWGSSGTDVFAAGLAGAILRYDGKTWASMTGGGPGDLHAIWGASSTDVFAAGAGGAILRCDGKAWTPMTSGTRNDLYALWGASGSDVFAAGTAGTVLRYDGKAWGAMSSGTRNDLYGVWGSSAADVFAVGSRGTIIHYDGKSWSVMPGGAGGLYAVWGSSGADVFAVGSSGAILHYDGKAWAPMTRNVISDLRGVWGASSAEVFAAGSSGAIVRYAPPDVTGVAPDGGNQGGTIDISIAGRNLTEASAVTLGAGIAVNRFAVAGPGRVTANITIVAGAEVGVRDVSVTTPGGLATLPGAFTVKQALPIVASVAPNQANQETSLNVIIAGANLAGASAVSFGPGITTSSFAVVSSNQITAGITVNAGAAVGARAVSVTTPGGTFTLPDGFAVRQAMPVIASVSPDQVSQGATLDVVVAGLNLHGATEVRFGPGVAVNRFVVSGTKEITANVTVVASAATGTRDVSVTTPGGSSFLPDSLTIKPGLPVIASVSPAEGSPGDILDILVSGSNLDGATGLSFGGEVTVNRFSNRSPTQIAASVTISGHATSGLRDVSVTTRGGTGALAGSFMVKEGPLGIVFLVVIWVGIAMTVVVVVFVLRVLRRRRAGSL